MGWSRFWRRARRDDDLARELEAYLAQETEDNVARGMSPQAAREAAHRRLGNVTRVRETVYDWNTLHGLDTLWRDLRYALRQLRSSPGFAIPAVLSLALGIGANTAVFQLLYSLVSRPLPVAQPSELHEIRMIGEGRVGRQTGRNRHFSLPLYEAVRDRQQAFSTLAAFNDTRFNLAPRGEVRYVEGLWVTGNFFPMLGIQPALGRLFTPADDRPGCGYHGAVISHHLWQREYGGRPDIVGHIIELGPDRVPIVGVTPASFFGVEVGRQFDLALPICSSGFGDRDHWFLAAIGRLKPGWTPERATAHLATLTPGVFDDTIPRTYRSDLIAKYRAIKFELRHARTGVSPLRRGYQEPLVVLMIIVGLVLVIAAVNLANLLLARATTRTQEFAIRLAVGGSRLRVMQQVFVESLVIAAAGALAGLALAVWASRSIVSLIGTSTDRIFLDLSLDWRVLGFTTAIAVLSAIAFGLVPALRAARAGVSLTPGARGTTAGLERFRTRRLLVAAQVGLSLVLVCAALLFTRSFRHLITSDSGLKTDGLLVANMFFREADYPEQTRFGAFKPLEERLRALPGVTAIAKAGSPPLSGAFMDSQVKVDGKTVGKTNMSLVSAGYFAATGTALRAGRDFNAGDTRAAENVAIATDAFVRAYLPGGSPIGRVIARPAHLPGRPDVQYRIVGVAQDSTYYSVKDEFAPMLFLPETQQTWEDLVRRYMIRSSVPPDTLIKAISARLAEFDPNASVRYVRFGTQIEESLLRERLMARLSGIFGLLAVVLAIVGLYGVTAYTVARRTNEIGIRLALGASRGHIFRMMIGELGSLLAIGLASGLMLVLLLGRSVRTLVYGIDPFDATTIAIAMLVLAAAAGVAGLVPARRAVRIDAGQSLRAL